VVREETGLDVITIFNEVPIVVVYAFEHCWFNKQGVDCKWMHSQSDEETVVGFLSS
jgi:hypothetical protein|tara:strand:+ start:4269 stop:4436 length:168 start_codon:yes stop_codon:yes gene_type:complete